MIRRLTDRVRSFLRSDVPQRAFRTFVQAFVAQLALVDQPTRQAAVVSAAAAALSAVWNKVISPALERFRESRNS
jgi:hypothetical protein